MSQTLSKDSQVTASDEASAAEPSDRSGRGRGRATAVLGGLAAVAGFAVGRLAKAGRAGGDRGERGEQ